MQNLPPVMINHLSRFVFLNLKRNWLGYLIFASFLYLLTPFTPQLNPWHTVRARLITLLELPVKAIDVLVEHKP